MTNGQEKIKTFSIRKYKETITLTCITKEVQVLKQINVQENTVGEAIEEIRESF